MPNQSERNRKYRHGDLKSLLPILEDQLSVHLEEGNDVGWARVFSQYGIAQIFLANHYATSIIHKQMDDEYRWDEFDPRKKAVYSRFLALHAAFHGDKEAAARLYREGFLYFEQLDWQADEALMILESIYFFSLPYCDRPLLFQGIERLRRLEGDMDESWVTLELALLDHALSYLQQPNQRQGLMEFLHHELSESSYFGSFFFWVTCLHVEDLLFNLPMSNSLSRISNLLDNELSLAQFARGLIDLHTSFAKDQNLKGLDGVERLKAKAALFKHPWYRLLAGLVSISIYPDNIRWGDRVAKHLEAPDYQSLSENTIIGWWKQRLEDSALALHHPRQGFQIDLFREHTIRLGEKKLAIFHWKSQHLREFFLYLVMHPQGRIAKEIVMEELFSDDDLKKSLNRLYVSIHRLNRFLHDYFGEKEAFIQIQQGFVCINPDQVEEIDVQAYRKLTSVAHQLWHQDEAAAVELMEKACQIYTDELLSDYLYLDWLNRYRENLKQGQEKVLRRLADYYVKSGDKHAYEEVFRRLIQLDPYNESFYEEYITYLLGENRQLEAYEWYDEIKTLLDKEFGLHPSFAFIK